jgi:hypothetical protein
MSLLALSCLMIATAVAFGALRMELQSRRLCARRVRLLRTRLRLPE